MLKPHCAICRARRESLTIWTIANKSPARQIKVEIEAALERRVDAAGQDISDGVNGGDLALTGYVTS